MPELPEVETVRQGLAPVMEGRRLLAVEARRPDLRFPFPDGFAARLTGTRFETLGRRGKYLRARLGSGETLIMHLGMSGRFTIETTRDAAIPGDFVHARAVDPAHDHVVFHMEGGATVTFNDPRRFGYMLLAPTADIEATPPFDAMGPEPLSDEFDAAAFQAAMKGKIASIKAALLDQRVVAGLGNIYVCEALFLSGISPRRAAGTVTGPRAKRLVANVKATLERAIAAGGSSLRDYAHADGSLGYFQHAFAVYGREGEACVTPGCGHAVKRIVQQNRSTFFCSRCQR